MKDNVFKSIDDEINRQTHLEETKENLHKLRQISEKLLEPELAVQIVEHAQRAIIIVRKDGSIFYVNKLAEVIFEYPRQELWDKNLDVLMPEQYIERHHEMFARYTVAPRPRDFKDPLYVTAKKKSGSEVPLAIALLPVVISAGMFIVASIEPRV